MATTAEIRKTNKTRYPKQKSKWKFQNETYRGIEIYEFFDSTPRKYDNVILMDASKKAFQREQLAFLAISESDKQKYRNEYVAVYQSQIVDADKDASNLLKRFREKYGNVTLYIGKVNGNRVPKILTPRRIR
jgi:Family of unknown function (DUF5678)